MYPSIRILNAKANHENSDVITSFYCMFVRWKSILKRLKGRLVWIIMHFLLCNIILIPSLWNTQDGELVILNAFLQYGYEMK